MKYFLVLFLLLSNSAWALDTEIKQGFHNESEAGVVSVSGNSESQSFNLKQGNTYNWEKDRIIFNGKYLQTSTGGKNSALNWFTEFRYERELSDHFSLFAAQSVESDPFSGYEQRYNSDLGGKYGLYKLDSFFWNLESGYRYTVENRSTGQVKQSYIRIYTEANKDWTKTFSTKLWVEALPNLSVSSDYQFNSELSASAAISSIFAIKSGYLVKYRHDLVGIATKRTDTQLTTSLVAKF